MKKGQRWPALVTARNARMSYFLAFLAFFAFFAMLTSCSPTIGNSGIRLEPITGTNSFLSELRADSKILANDCSPSSSLRWIRLRSRQILGTAKPR